MLLHTALYKTVLPPNKTSNVRVSTSKFRCMQKCSVFQQTLYLRICKLTSTSRFNKSMINSIVILLLAGMLTGRDEKWFVETSEKAIRVLMLKVLMVNTAESMFHTLAFPRKSVESPIYVA